VERRLLLDIAVQTTVSLCSASGSTLLLLIRESPAILELFSGKDKTLLIGRDAFLVLNLRLHVVDCVRRFDLEGNRLSGQGFHKYLHTSTKAEDEMERGLLLDIATRNVGITMGWTSRYGLLVGKSAPVFELLAGEDQPLLIGGNTLLVLNLRLHIVDSIGRLDFKGDRLASQSLDKDLHTTPEAQDFANVSIPRGHNDMGETAHQGGGCSPSGCCYQGTVRVLSCGESAALTSR